MLLLTIISWLSRLFLSLNPQTAAQPPSFKSSFSQDRARVENDNNLYSQNSFVSTPESNSSGIKQYSPFEQNFNMYNLNGDATTLLPNSQKSSHNTIQKANAQCKS